MAAVGQWGRISHPVPILHLRGAEEGTKLVKTKGFGFRLIRTNTTQTARIGHIYSVVDPSDAVEIPQERLQHLLEIE